MVVVKFVNKSIFEHNFFWFLFLLHRLILSYLSIMVTSNKIYNEPSCPLWYEWILALLKRWNSTAAIELDTYPLIWSEKCHKWVKLEYFYVTIFKQWLMRSNNCSLKTKKRRGKNKSIFQMCRHRLCTWYKSSTAE